MKLKTQPVPCQWWIRHNAHRLKRLGCAVECIEIVLEADRLYGSMITLILWLILIFIMIECQLMAWINRRMYDDEHVRPPKSFLIFNSTPCYPFNGRLLNFRSLLSPNINCTIGRHNETETNLLSTIKYLLPFLLFQTLFSYHLSQTKLRSSQLRWNLQVSKNKKLCSCNLDLSSFFFNFD